MDTRVSTPTNLSVTNPFTPPPPSKRPSSQTLLLIVTTVVVGVAVPTTVLLVQQQNDIRGRAAEPKNTKPLTTASPQPREVSCGGSCTSHADCAAGFFCNSGLCKNALCPTSIDCVCRQQ